MCSARDNAALPTLGSPIRESTGQRPFNASPWLIAVVHALHRLLVPRHPPCALTILTVIVRAARRRATGDTQLNFFADCAVFKVRARNTHTRRIPKGTRRGRSLKTQQRGRRPRGPARRPSSVDILGCRSARWRRAHSLVRELPRKEVIQPQLPLRLPCYDFTPITSPTFDGSLPEGLGHRLRVLPAFVV